MSSHRERPKPLSGSAGLALLCPLNNPPRWMICSLRQFLWDGGRTGRTREGCAFSGFRRFVVHQCSRVNSGRWINGRSFRGAYVSQLMWQLQCRTVLLIPDAVSYRVGGGITPAVLPHHTDVPFGIRRFMKQTGSVGECPPAKPAPCDRTMTWERLCSYAGRRRSTKGLARWWPTSTPEPYRSQLSSDFVLVCRHASTAAIAAPAVCAAASHRVPPTRS